MALYICWRWSTLDTLQLSEMFTSILPKPSQYGWIAQKFSLYHHGLTLYSTWLNGFWTKSCLFASGSRHRYWFLPHCIILPSTNLALPLFRLRQPEFEPYERLAVCQYYFPEVLMGARHVIVHRLTTALRCGASSALWTLFDNDVSCSVRVATMHIVIVFMSRYFLSSNNMNLVTKWWCEGHLISWSQEGVRLYTLYRPFLAP